MVELCIIWYNIIKEYKKEEGKKEMKKENKNIAYYCYNTDTKEEFYIYKWQIFKVLSVRIKEAIAEKQYDEMMKNYY